MANINQKDTPNKDSPGAIDERAEQLRRKAEREVQQAAKPEGGAGGRSGTGQAQPHHGFDDTSGEKAKGEPVDKDAILPEPDSGPSYQSGGSGLDLEQEVEERKQRESGVGKTFEHGPGMDPLPGAPSRGSS
ncbi:MAG: hypothetical protein OQK79_01005 [Rhodanobacter sp.]|jgi:hypothetical protein|nr:hypothetical protein [Rhodanobacter sp.]